VGESLTCFLFALVILLRLPETREHEDRVSRAFTGIGRVFTDRGFLLVCLANLLVTSVYTQQLVTLPLFVRFERGLTLTDHGLLLSLNGLLIVTLEMIVVARTRRVPPLFAIAAGSALMGLGFGALPLTAGLGGMALCAAVWTFGEMVAWPVMPVWIVSRAPGELRGRYLGVIGLFTGVSLLLGASGGTWLVENHGQGALWRTSFWVSQAAAAAVLLLAVVERVRERRRAAPGPEAG
jgi:predicted MFS family arabinose efflux permease